MTGWVPVEGEAPGPARRPADKSVAPAREGEGNVSRKDDSVNDFTSSRRQSDRGCVIAAFPELHSYASKRPPANEHRGPRQKERDNQLSKTIIPLPKREVFARRRLFCIFLPLVVLGMGVYLYSFTLTATINGGSVLGFIIAGAAVLEAARDGKGQ